jgi:hypothetical protein
MLESGSSGSVRGASRNGRPYREPRGFADLQGRSSERTRSARKRSSTNAEVAPMRRSLAATERKTAQSAAALGTWLHFSGRERSV